MKKILFIFAILSIFISNAQNRYGYTNRDANKVGIGSALTVIGHAFIRDGLGNNYGYYPAVNPVAHIFYVMNGIQHCRAHTNCYGLNNSSYQAIEYPHEQYLGNDGYYYCYDNCRGPKPCMRTNGNSYYQQKVDVYRQARGPDYHAKFNHDRNEYLKRLHRENRRYNRNYYYRY